MADNEVRQMEALITSLASGPEEARQAIADSYGENMLDAIDGAAADIQESAEMDGDPESGGKLTRSDFDALSPREKQRFISNQGRVVPDDKNEHLQPGKDVDGFLGLESE